MINILIAGDFNIGISNLNDEDTSYFTDLWDTFNFNNLVTKPTCYKSFKGSIIDLILTNKRSFQKVSVCETWLSDCKLVFTILKSTLIKLSPKQIT